MTKAFLPHLTLCIATLLLPAVGAYADVVPAPTCARIVSLSPSVTETLYVLGLGDSIVGVTRYCLYPVQAQAKPKVGGFLDPSNETIASLTPSLVITVREQEEERRFLETLGIKTLSVEHKSIKGILNSIDEIASICGRAEEGRRLRADLEQRVEAVRQRSAGRPRVRVLVAVGGNEQDGELSHLFVSGRDGYYDQMLSIVGADNVYSGTTANLPSLSKEGLIVLNPEVVIQIGSESDGLRVAPEAILRAWSNLYMISAVKNKRIHILTQDFASIPGPRFVLLLEEFARVIQP